MKTKYEFYASIDCNYNRLGYSSEEEFKDAIIEILEENFPEEYFNIHNVDFDEIIQF